MFSFLHILNTADFKADGWILITVKTKDLHFCLDVTTTSKKTHFLGLMESSLSVASSVNGQTRKINKKRRKNPQEEWWVRNRVTEWCLTQPGDLFNPMQSGYLLLAGGCSHVLCSSLHRNHIPIPLHNWQRILQGFPLITCQGKGKTFSCVSDFQSLWISQNFILQFPELFLQSVDWLPQASCGVG